MDQTASVIIGLALLCYTVGVWSERIAGRLRAWHLAFFWLGLIFDTWGTGMMFEVSEGFTFDIHGVTGMIAIVLMFVHAAWASAVLLRNDEHWITRFHTFSIIVWLIWLVPYFSPMFFALG